MAKRVQLTERIKTLLGNRGVDDFSKVAVYECVAASTRPINQRHSVYHEARMTPSMLSGFGAYLEQESVPLQLIHESHNLPTGQVLEAKAYTEGFDTELNALFYVQDGTEEATKLDLGIIDEVSVGALSKHARCSKCGFDYFENDKRKVQLVWERTCDNEHTLGEDGCHLILDGVAKWQELSLVPKGASSRPKVLTVDKQRLATDESYRTLAASGVNPEMLVLHAGIQIPKQSTKDDDMEAKEILAQLTQVNVELGTARGQNQMLETQLSAANQEIASLKTQLQAAQTAPSERETTLQASLETVNAELSDVKTSNSQMMDFLKESYQKAQAVLGQEAKENPSLDEILACVKDARLALHQIPVGGVANGSEQADDEDPTPAMSFSSAAYQTR